MKEISYGKSACILLFSALGVFSYFLLLYHTELQERIPDIKISLIALSITIAVFNLFGFSLLVSSHWMATNYPLYYICLLYTSPSPRDPKTSRMPSSA